MYKMTKKWEKEEEEGVLVAYCNLDELGLPRYFQI